MLTTRTKSPPPPRYAVVVDDRKVPDHLYEEWKNAYVRAEDYRLRGYNARIVNLNVEGFDSGDYNEWE